MPDTFLDNINELRDKIADRLIKISEDIHEKTGYMFAGSMEDLSYYVDSIMAHMFVLTYGRFHDMGEKKDENDVRMSRYQWVAEQLAFEDDVKDDSDPDYDPENAIREKLRYVIDKRTDYHSMELNELGYTGDQFINIPKKHGAIYFDRANFEQLRNSDKAFKAPPHKSGRNLHKIMLY